MIASTHCTHDVCTVRHVCYTLPNETKNRSNKKKSVAAQYIGCAVVHKNIYIYCWAAGPMRNEGTAQQQRRNKKNEMKIFGRKCKSIIDVTQCEMLQITIRWCHCTSSSFHLDKILLYRGVHVPTPTNISSRCELFVLAGIFYNLHTNESEREEGRGNEETEIEFRFYIVVAPVCLISSIHSFVIRNTIKYQNSNCKIINQWAHQMSHVLMSTLQPATTTSITQCATINGFGTRPCLSVYTVDNCATHSQSDTVLVCTNCRI